MSPGKPTDVMAVACVRETLMFERVYTNRGSPRRQGSKYIPTRMKERVCTYVMIKCKRQTR